MKSNAGTRPTGPLDDNYLDAHLYGDEGDIVAPLLGVTFDQYMEAHAADRKSKHYAWTLNSDFGELLKVVGLHENHQITALTKGHGLKWIEWLKTERLNPRRPPAKAVTIAMKLGRIRHFLQWCVSQDHLQDNPFRDVKLPVRQVTNSKIPKVPLTDAEIATVFRAIVEFAARPPVHRQDPKPQKRVEFLHCCRLLAATGARCMEILQ